MNKHLQVKATREAGAVRRCHIVPHHGQYNIAQHSYGAVSLLLLLHPDPSLNLIKAVQWHDVGERWLGDMPAPAKWSNPELGRVYEAAEARVLKALDLLPDLTRDEGRWLRAVDILDLLLWCREEAALGNTAVSRMLRSCVDAMDRAAEAGTLPEPVRAFYQAEGAQNHHRLSDIFEEALADGLGEAEA